jgi:hypothetical protein
MMKELLRQICGCRVIDDDEGGWMISYCDYHGHKTTAAQKAGEAVKTFTVTAEPKVMKRFERLLAMMHFCSSWGHSSYFGMPLDGDGPDRFKVAEVTAIPKEERSKLAKEVENNMKGDLELAFDDSYGNRRLQPRINVEV